MLATLTSNFHVSPIITERGRPRACAVYSAARQGQPAAAASGGGGDAGTGPPGGAVLLTSSPRGCRGAWPGVPACRAGLARLRSRLHRHSLPRRGRDRKSVV